jgi:hypothetical protein
MHVYTPANCGKKSGWLESMLHGYVKQTPRDLQRRNTEDLPWPAMLQIIASSMVINVAYDKKTVHANDQLDQRWAFKMRRPTRGALKGYVGSESRVPYCQ